MRKKARRHRQTFPIFGIGLTALLMAIAVGAVFILANSEEKVSPAILWAQFDALYDAGQYEEAIIIADELIERYPRKANYYLNRGIAKATLRRYREAMVDFDRAIELKPAPEPHQNVLIAAYFNRGIAYADWDKREDARTDWAKALELAREADDFGWIEKLEDVMMRGPTWRPNP